MVAATRLPGVALHDGTTRPDGTVLLLHTTVMADSDAEALGLLAALQDGTLAGHELGHVQGRTSVLEENAAQTAQNPEGHRYAVDCTWTDGQERCPGPDAARAVERARHRALVLHLVRVGAARDLPDMAFSVEANVYVATYAIYTDPADDARYSGGCTAGRPRWPSRCGAGVYLGDTDFTRRQDRFMSGRRVPPSRRDPGRT